MGKNSSSELETEIKNSLFTILASKYVQEKSGFLPLFKNQ